MANEAQHVCLIEFGRLGKPLAAISGVLQRIQSLHGPIHGRYVSPETHLRCDGGSQGNAKESAIFLSMPYLKPDKLVIFTEKMLRDMASHPSRPLYQAMSSFGNSTQRDKDQVFLKHDGRRSRKALWVNHVWVLIMGSGTILRELPAPQC